jgi:hypothetical protein
MNEGRDGRNQGWKKGRDAGMAGGDSSMVYLTRRRRC